MHQTDMETLALLVGILCVEAER
eukprot:COSAG02_NODE_47069_length_344_cov_0.420408_1_plen_22_part_01